MKPTAILVAATLALAMPAQAQDERGDMSEGLDLLSEGTRLLLRGLMNEMEPALKELERNLDNLNAYYPPEILPNGDIIIRRRVPLQVEPPEDDEVDL